VGEEDKKKTDCSGYCWIIDPLDGTVNFIHGVPLFCVSIALTKDTKTISGAVFAPFINEMFVAEEGLGAYLNGKKLCVSQVKKMLRSLVVTGFSYDIHSQSKQTMRSLSNVIIKAQGVRRLGSAALDLAYVAAGRFEAFWEKGLKPWDVAAGSLIVEEAGGKVSEFDGGNNYVFGNTLLASNGLIHGQMIGLIK
jgi:myo-inositol-1(or 4)-monophosphatase